MMQSGSKSLEKPTLRKPESKKLTVVLGFRSQAPKFWKTGLLDSLQRSDGICFENADLRR
jgi:hypothetical protein